MLREANARLADHVRDPYRSDKPIDFNRKGHAQSNVSNAQALDEKTQEPTKDPANDENLKTDPPKSSIQIIKDQLNLRNIPTNDPEEEQKLGVEDLTSSNLDSDSSDSEDQDAITNSNHKGSQVHPETKKLSFQTQSRNSIFIKSVGNADETAALLQNDDQSPNRRFTARKTLTPEQQLKREEKKKKVAISRVEEGAIVWDPTLTTEKTLQGAAARKFMEYGTLPANELYQIKYFNETMRRVSQAETLKNIALKAVQKYERMKSTISEESESP